MGSKISLEANLKLGPALCHLPKFEISEEIQLGHNESVVGLILSIISPEAQAGLDEGTPKHCLNRLGKMLVSIAGDRLHGVSFEEKYEGSGMVLFDLFDDSKCCSRQLVSL